MEGGQWSGVACQASAATSKGKCSKQIMSRVTSSKVQLIFNTHVKACLTKTSHGDPCVASYCPRSTSSNCLSKV